MKIDLSKFDKLSLEQWKDKVVYRGLHIKYKYQLEDLKKLYPEKIGRLQDRYNLLQPFISKIDFKDYGKIVEIYGLDFCLNKSLTEIQPIILEETEFLNNKIERLTDKYASTLKEIELRDNKLVVRKPKGTIYYIDLTNGNDDRTGLKIGPSTIDSTADTTHFIDDALTGADDYINGSYVWNVTRGIGALISDFVAATDEVTLATPIAGMTAGDTYYILDAWLTLGKYTTVESRTAGDIGKVRAGTTQIPVADIVFDEDGNADNMITVKGCDSSDDPWGDVSDVKPIIDFNNASYQMYLSTDIYWKFYNLEIRNSVDPLGSLYFTGSWYGYEIIEKCKFYNNNQGLRTDSIDGVFVKDCIFDANTYGIYVYSYNRIAITGCSFDGGNYGIYFYMNATPPILIDCSFGQTTTIGINDVYFRSNVNAYYRNCKWDKGFTFYTATSKSKQMSYEDDNEVFEAHKIETNEVTIERETTIVRAGGADSSAKITPTSVVGLYLPATLSGWYQGISPNGVFKIWLSADVEKTINIYIRGFGWTGFPTASQLFVRASYLSNAGTAARTELDSDEVIANNDDWIPFQVTLTPARDGFVYVDVFVRHYEASSGVYVDIKPVIT